MNHIQKTSMILFARQPHFYTTLLFSVSAIQRQLGLFEHFTQHKAGVHPSHAF
jgi:hypothetical protein